MAEGMGTGAGVEECGGRDGVFKVFIQLLGWFSGPCYNVSRVNHILTFLHIAMHDVRIIHMQYTYMGHLRVARLSVCRVYGPPGFILCYFVC